MPKNEFETYLIFLNLDKEIYAPNC